MGIVPRRKLLVVSHNWPSSWGPQMQGDQASMTTTGGTLASRQLLCLSVASWGCKNQTLIRDSWSRMRERQGGGQRARHAPERLIPFPGRVTPAMFLASPYLSPHNPTSHNEVVLLALKVLKCSALRPPGLIQCG